jgi:hypothetical protein
MSKRKYVVTDSMGVNEEFTSFKKAKYKLNDLAWNYTSTYKLLKKLLNKEHDPFDVCFNILRHPGTKVYDMIGHYDYSDYKIELKVVFP